MMGNSNSVVNKYEKEDFNSSINNETNSNRNNTVQKRQLDQQQTVKNSSDYDKLIMKEYFESQNTIINQLKDEIKKLREANQKLEQRVKKLEDKSSTSSTPSNSNGILIHSFDNFSTRVARNFDDLINLTPPNDSVTNHTNSSVNSNASNNKSELVKLKQAQDAAALASLNDVKNGLNERSKSDDHIITIDTTDTKNDLTLVSNNKVNTFKKRDSYAKAQPFLVETSNTNNTKNLNGSKFDASKAVVTARGGRDTKRISINLEQVDMTAIDVNGSEPRLSNDNKRNSIAPKDLALIENSSYYGIRNEKLVKIVHK